ncbi:hypothetical protein [Hasllibacter sp. MH4015]|uniref:hypothetical protein n=1 Tax=Hasllibacter sp. MH4015 TaxID=2854029 RepID=UPI001CD5936A|nr:hypothetical protein [Hasllibacter sp. MH4015]
MTRYALPFGFGFIGLAMLALALVLYLHMLSELRIGERLVADGVATDALLVTAEHRERLSCRGGTIKVCRPSDFALGQIVYLVEGRRAVTTLTINEADFTAFSSGEEVRVPILYLPDDPLEIERSRGARLNAARGQTLTIVVCAAFGITFALIGAIAGLVVRKRAGAP